MIDHTVRQVVNEEALRHGLVLGTFKGVNLRVMVVTNGKDKVTKKPRYDAVVSGNGRDEAIIRSVNPSWDADQLRAYLQKNYADKFRAAGGVVWEGLANEAANDLSAAHSTPR